MRRAPALLLWLTISQASQERATVFQSGPFEVYSVSSDRTAREVLNKLEQFRYAFGTLLGKPEAQSIWPVRIRVVRQARSDAASSPLVFKRDHWESTVSSAGLMTDRFLYQLGSIFLEATAGPMPEWADRGLLTLLSTLEVDGTRIILGGPPPEAQRDRDWARMHMLAVQPEYSGKLRVLLANLQRGADPDPSFWNAFEKPRSEIERQVDAYLAAGQFETISVSGRPINPERDFQGKPAPLAGPETKSAVDLLEEGDLAAASKANPHWGEPVFRAALKEADAGKRLAGIRKAVELEPRNPRYREALAKAIEENKLAIEEQEQQQKLEAQHELERLKDEALRRIRNAELRANEGKPRVDESKVVPWWDGPQPSGQVDGILQRVDCMSGLARLTVSVQGGKPVSLAVRSPADVVIQGSSVTSLSCGVQKPPRRVTIQYFPKFDANLGTAGDVAVVEFK